MKKKYKFLINGIFTVFILVLTLLFTYSDVKAEGSGNWTGTQTNRQTMLYAHSISGFMLDESTRPGYDPKHRFYVYVKAGETVFWGFRVQNRTGNWTLSWYYDATSSDFFPEGTSGASRTFMISNSISDVGGTGVPGTQLDALNGPSQVTGNGYTAYSFTNNTGADRAFWVEITTTNPLYIDWWDVTVVSGTSGNYTEHTGRVYCRKWSIRNGFPDTQGQPNAQSFHDNFGFYVPVENPNTATDDYFVKYINLGRSNGGGSYFVINDFGPTNTSTYDVNRKSISGSSSIPQYPLFISNPDVTLWPSTTSPVASQTVRYSKKTPPGTGGEATFTVTIDNPGIVDIVVDLNNNGQFDGNDVLISNYYSTPGTYNIYWNGEDANGNDVPSGTTIKFETSFLFYPIHFPIFDLEQCLGISIKNIRPGNEYNEVIYWDDSNLPISTSQSVQVNLTGTQSPEHIWWADGNNGFGNDNTVNTWTGSKVLLVREVTTFDWDDADLEVQVSVSPQKQVAGQNVTFTITATNHGISPATGVSVNDVLPSGYTFVSATPSKGTWAAPTWTIGNLAKDETATLTIVATVQPTGTYQNNVSISGNETDPDNTNNSASATLVNNGVLAVNDIAVTRIYQAISGNVLTNDIEPDGQTLTVNTTPVSGPSNGTLILNADGTYTYTPTAGFFGEDTFVYEVCDNGAPQTCDQASVTIEILPFAMPDQEAPVAVNDAYVGSINQTVTGDLLANDLDSDGDALTVSAATADTDGDGVADNVLTLGVSTSVYGTDLLGATVVAGNLTVNGNGTMSFVPNTGFKGDVEFNYVNTDGTLFGTGSGKIDITENHRVNTTYALNDAVKTEVGNKVSGNVLDNDYDPEGDNISITSPGTYATAHGSITINADGSYEYTPSSLFTGDDSYTYSMCDNGSPQACDIGTIYFTVTPLPTADNDDPVALNDSYRGNVNTTITGNVIDNDSDIDGNLDNNSVTLVNGGSAAANGTLTLNSNGTFTYVPNSGYTGQVSFIYQVCDNGSPALCDQATVYLDVIEGNITTAVDDAFIGVKVNSLSGNVLANDFDPQGHTQTVNTIPVSGPSNGTLVLNADGTFTYTPNAGFYGTDQFVYEVCDNGSPQACDKGTVFVRISKRYRACVISNRNIYSK